ncbi:hypothetical protein [Rhodoblastus acidophilus]|uniref:hypothetical protein n=1 Tax=Rhodoblastus acidophilus TaxID=1074 RepID=UPI0011306844|nr:hypothetical protein [Rhodoblastus acidophilus]
MIALAAARAFAVMIFAVLAGGGLTLVLLAAITHAEKKQNLRFGARRGIRQAPPPRASEWNDLAHRLSPGDAAPVVGFTRRTFPSSNSGAAQIGGRVHRKRQRLTCPYVIPERQFI